jgi:hypothetical protein
LTWIRRGTIDLADLRLPVPDMKPIKPLAIDHVVLRAKDVPRACAWYAAVLGCKVERESD